MAGSNDGVHAAVTPYCRKIHAQEKRAWITQAVTDSILSVPYGFPSHGTYQQTPWASMASATFVKPAMFAPIT